MSSKWPETVAILCLAITKLCRPPPPAAALLSPLVTKHEHSTPGSGSGSVNAPDISAHISEINGKLRLKCHKLTFLFVYNLLADAVCLERKIYTVLFLDGKIQGKYEFPNVLTLSQNFKLNWWFRKLRLSGETNKKLHYAIISNDCGEIASDFWEVFAIVFTSKIFSNFCWNALKSSNISLCRAGETPEWAPAPAPTQWCWHIYVSNYMSSNMTRAGDVRWSIPKRGWDGDSQYQPAW